MPKVPRAEETRIQDTLTPAPPAVPVPGLEAFGGGEPAAAVSRQVQSNLQQAQQIALDERQRVRQAKHGDLDDQLIRKSIDFKTRLASVKGLAAQDEYDAIQKDYEDFHGEITKDVSDPRLLEATRQSFMKRSRDLDAYSQNYILVERRAYEKDKFEARQESLAQSALARHRRADGSIDHDAIEDTMHERTLLIFDRAPLEGWSGEVVGTRVRKMRSTTHRDVILLMSSQQDYVGADEYLKQFKGDMDGGDRRTVTDVVEKGNFRGEIQGLTQQYLDRGLSEKETLKQARDETEGKVENSLVTSLKNRFSEARRIEDQQNRELFEQWRVEADKPQNQDRLPEDYLSQLGWDTAPSWMRDSLNTKLKPRPNDTARWLGFRAMTRTQKGRDTIAGWSFEEFHKNIWEHMDASHQERVLNTWVSLSRDSEEDRQNLVRLNSESEIIDRAFRSTLKSGGKKFTPSQEKKFERFEERVQQAFDAFVGEEGRKALTEKEAERIVKEELARTVYLPGWSWSPWDDPDETLVAKIEENDIGEVLVPIEKLSAEEVEVFRKRLEANEINTEGDVGRANIEALAGAVYSANRELIREILSKRN